MKKTISVALAILCSGAILHSGIPYINKRPRGQNEESVLGRDALSEWHHSPLQDRRAVKGATP